jgi:hypothetical protein
MTSFTPLVASYCDDWQKQCSIAVNISADEMVKNEARKTVDVANAKAEQTLDHIVSLYQVIYPIDPKAADYVFQFFKRKLSIIADVHFSKHLNPTN